MENLRWENENIIIRLLVETDYHAFVRGFTVCQPSRNRFDEGCFDTSFMTYPWYEALLQRRRREMEQDYCYMFHIFRKKDGVSLGECDIAPHRRDDMQYAQIGYTIYNPYWNQGIATACVKGLVDIAFDRLHLHRLEACVNLDNPASKRVLQKAGFAFECVRKKFILEDDGWTDNEVYYLNNENWQT